MWFTPKQLAYSVAAGEAGGTLRAAEDIFVSQTPISNAITRLEAEFQLRTGVNSGLTPCIATLASLRKTILVDAGSEFCRAQVGSARVSGMTRL